MMDEKTSYGRKHFFKKKKKKRKWSSILHTGCRFSTKPALQCCRWGWSVVRKWFAQEREEKFTSVLPNSSLFSMRHIGSVTIVVIRRIATEFIVHTTSGKLRGSLLHEMIRCLQDVWDLTVKCIILLSNSKQKSWLQISLMEERSPLPNSSTYLWHNRGSEHSLERCRGRWVSHHQMFQSPWDTGYCDQQHHFDMPGSVQHTEHSQEAAIWQLHGLNKERRTSVGKNVRFTVLVARQAFRRWTFFSKINANGCKKKPQS